MTTEATDDAAPNDTANLEALVRALRTRAPLDAAELLAKQPAEQIEQALKLLPADFAMRIAAQLPGAGESEAPELDIPGSITELMEPARGILTPDTTVAAAGHFLRHADNPGDITYLYVADAQQKLLGLIVIRDLLIAKPNQTLSEIMVRDPFRLTPSMDTSEALKAVIKRHYPVYPVCDESGVMLGIVRGWKLFEKQAIEIVAQSGRMVGVDKEERVSTSIMEAFKKRHPWLQINLLTAFLAGFVVSMFEDTISQIVTLAAFLPILAGQSGNNGCQALAITLRGYTLGDLDSIPLRHLIRKEVTLGAMNGFLTGIVAGLAMWWTADANGPLLGAVICAAMTGACMASGLFGVIVPLTLKKFGADPATASSIFLTTGTDIAGMGLMLFLATAFVL